MNNPRILTTAILILTLVAFARAAPPTAAEVQAMIDALADGAGIPTHAQWPVGGVVTLPAGTIELDRTLKLWGGVRLRGESKSSTILRRRQGTAVQFSCRNDHLMPVGEAVSDLGIYADAGDCIGLDEEKAWNEGSYLTVEDCVLNAPAGTPLNLRHANGAYLYFTTLEDVVVSGWRTNAVNLASRGASINRVYVNGGDETTEKPDGRAMVSLSGFGTVTNSRLEGGWNSPLIEMTDAHYTFTGNWCETGRSRLNGAVPYQARLTRSTLTIDYPFFVQPKQPYVLRERSTVSIIGPSNGATNDAGGVPVRENYRDVLGRISEPKYQAAVRAMLRQGFEVDATSELRHAGAKLLP